MSFRFGGRLRAPRRVVAIVLALAIGVPATALAADVFGDVPGTNVFKPQIEALAGAGITAGCGGGNFCPTAQITREQEAAFLNRALPRVARTVISSEIPIPAGGTVPIGSVSILVGGTDALGIGANQFVKVDVTFSLYGEPSGCPCNFRADLREQGVGESGADGVTYGVIPAGESQQTVNISRVFEAAPGTHTYNLTTFWSTGTGSMNVRYGSIIATTIPFGYNGGNSLGQVVVSGAEAEQVAPGANAGD